MASSEVMGGAICCTCVCGVVFFIIMLATGLKTMDNTQWSLKYSFWDESVDEHPIDTPGMKWVGMGNHLLRFPNVNKNVMFRNTIGRVGDGDIMQKAISVRTYDGLIVDLSMEFTYRLQINNLRNLYMLVGDQEGDNGMQSGWHGFLVRISSGVIDNWATTFVARDFYTNRSQVALVFEEHLRRVLKESLFLDLQTLQLQDVDFSSAKRYEQSIQDTTDWAQRIPVAHQSYKTREIQQATKLKTAKELAAKTIIAAQGNAEQTMLNNAAQVEQYKNRVRKEAEGYSKQMEFFRSQNAGTAVNDFISYMQTRVLRNHDESKLSVHLQPVR
eukprot:TRINITY_DN124193_c0_g1_i1.p1 TRINITY_DN124193_c0_g1~~TRINITY_DN124193_c0_g1_i1.p1  ORF type:complete len:329 (-),score=96.54 TRINITY_DN124193_c0_g1_i1:163-1149(-)